MPLLEPAGGTFRAAVRDLPRHASLGTLSYAFIAFVFATTGPLLLLLNAAAIGRLTPSQTATWIFASYGFGGLLGLVLSLWYRMPMGSAWSIPGVILVGTFLSHFTLADAVGVYLVVGAVCVLLGVTGIFKYIVSRIPLPIILGMVSAVLLPLAVNIVSSVSKAPLHAGGAVIAFLVASAFAKLSRKVPPILWAIVVGVLLAVVGGTIDGSNLGFGVVSPEAIAPRFNRSALVELALPLMLTMLAVQNAQSFALLRGLGYGDPPINAVTTATGVSTMLGAFLGSHGACTAPVMIGIMGSDEVGPKEGRYVAGVFNGLMLIGFAVLAPVATGLARAMPATLISVLGGLSLIPVLAASFGKAFEGKFRLGALAAFIITISNLTIARIGAPFWGIVGGVIVSLVLEPHDFKSMVPTPQRRASDQPAP